MKKVPKLVATNTVGRENYAGGVSWGEAVSARHEEDKKDKK